jgi:hypothetical protein
MTWRTILAAALLAGTGCYYGAMQGARTLGDGNLSLSGNLMMPAFFSSSDKQEAEESREDYIETFGSVSFAMGATDNVDLGFTAMAYGLGPQVKYSFTPRESETAISALATITYVMPMQVVLPHGSLAIGYLVGPDFEVYGGLDAGYGPDLANIPEAPDGGDDWDNVENTFFQDLRAGCVYTIKGEGSGEHYGAMVPAAVVFEFAFPLDLSRNMIIAGLGVMY